VTPDLTKFLYFVQKQKFAHHLCEFYHRTQSRKFIFASRITELQNLVEYLGFEETVVYEYIEVNLLMHN